MGEKRSLPVVLDADGLTIVALDASVAWVVTTDPDDLRRIDPGLSLVVC